jgi:hypothetical protein
LASRRVDDADAVIAGWQQERRWILRVGDKELIDGDCIEAVAGEEGL